MTIIYLACPYTSPYPAVSYERQLLATQAAAVLAEEGHTVFSPITHGHQLAPYLHPDNLHSHDFWMAQCLPILTKCSLFLILPLPGWRESKGVEVEAQHALLHRINGAFFQNPPEGKFPMLEVVSKDAATKYFLEELFKLTAGIPTHEGAPNAFQH